MYKRFLSFTLLVLLVFSFLFGGVVSFAKTREDKDEATLEGILCYEMQASGADSLQGWLDGALAEGAGLSSEWFVLALVRYDPSLDFTRYAEALEAYITQHTLTSITTKQKYAFLLAVLGRASQPFVADVLENTAGEGGVMSYIFALHLLHLGLPIEGYTAESLCEGLLSLRLDDGGWALSGSLSDTDVTAMALQALAPHTDKAQVRDAVESALLRLSSMQKESGGFASYGTENAESAAQVIIALTACGIHPDDDSRFIKNGYTPLDALSSYCLPDGSFSHTADGQTNRNATAQALMAYLALSLFEKGETSLYLFGEVDYDPSLIGQEDDENKVGSGEINAADEKDRFSLWQYIASGAVFLIAAAVTLLLALKKKKPRDILLALGVGVLLIVLILCINVKRPDDYYGSGSVSDPIGNVTLEIRCDTVAGRKAHIPENGVILAAKSYPIGEDTSVYDLLLYATKEARIPIEASVGVSAYIHGIANLYEYDFGDLSGWVYTVNGVRPSEAASLYALRDGDCVVFHYTLDLGSDIDGGEDDALS